LLSPTGSLVFTTWDFLGDAKLKDRLLRGHDLQEYCLEHNLELAENDYLLAWQNQERYRYVHYYTQTEVTRLIEESGFRLKKTYRADGRNAKMNQYFILSPRNL
jgi:hypothetical protein